MFISNTIHLYVHTHWLNVFLYFVTEHSLDKPLKKECKTQMGLSRQIDEYIDNVDTFVDFAYNKSSSHGKNVYPCKKCDNVLWQPREMVHDLNNRPIQEKSHNLGSSWGGIFYFLWRNKQSSCRGGRDHVREIQIDIVVYTIFDDNHSISYHSIIMIHLTFMII